jgi:hypothetical protein
MESKTLEPDEFAPEEAGFSEALREAVEEEMEFLEDRDIRLVRLRENDEGEVQQVTVQADDEMYRLSEVSNGTVSRTVFRDPPRDDAVPYRGADGEDTTAEKDEGADTEEESDEQPS